MDQPSGYVKNGESAYPRNQQHYKKQCPNAHSSSAFSPVVEPLQFIPPYAASRKKEGVEALDELKIVVDFATLSTDFA